MILRFRRILQHVALIAVSVWAIGAQRSYRVPGGAALAALPWIGTMLAVLELILLLSYLTRGVPEGETLRLILHRSEAGLTLVILAFGFYSLFLTVNARMTLAAPIAQRSTVLALSGGEPDSWRAAYPTADLASWRVAGRTERILLYPAEHRDLWGGRPVLVFIRQGALSLPWIVRVLPDEEPRLRGIIEAFPTAAQPRKDLVILLHRRARYDEAVRACLEYLAIYPNDLDFALRFTSELYSASRWPDAVTVLEPFLARVGSDPGLNSQLGFAMTRAGRHKEGIALLEKAAAADPDNWWIHYALGYAHYDAGEHAAAVAPFERVLQLKPTFPEITHRLREIRAEAKIGRF